MKHRYLLCAFVVGVLLFIDTGRISAQFRWNPLAGEKDAENESDVPPTLRSAPDSASGVESPGTAPDAKVPRIQASHLSMPKLNLPALPMPAVTMPRLTLPQVNVPKLPRPQLNRRILPQFNKGGQRLLESAGTRSERSGLGSGRPLLPAMRSAVLKTPVLKTPTLKTPALKRPDFKAPIINVPSLNSPRIMQASKLSPLSAGQKRAQVKAEEPQTITGWLAQPRPE